MRYFLGLMISVAAGIASAASLPSQLSFDGKLWFTFGSQADCLAAVPLQGAAPEVRAKLAAGLPAIFTCSQPVAFSPAPAPAATGRTFYVDTSAASDAGTGSATSPKKFIGSGLALLSAAGGDTLVIRPGTYGDARDAIGDTGAGKAGAWNVVKAETDGTVVITAGLGLSHRVDHYLQLEGLRFESPTVKSISGRFVKVLRCAFKDGPKTGNTMVLDIGTNDATPGAQYILVEDSYVYGAGGRYTVLVYNADKVILRRVVARHGDGWVQEAGAPQGTVALYNSTDVLTQNLVIVDSGVNDPNGYFEAALYHPSNSRASANIRNVGAMILNTKGPAVGWDDSATVTGMVLEDSVIARSTSVGAVIGGGHKQVTMRRVTINGTGSHGVALYGSSLPSELSLTDSVLANIGGDLTKNMTAGANVVSTQPASNLRPVGAAGATIAKRLGKSGTLYGEAGFDQVQADDLFPLANEAAIRKAMCTDAGVTTGFCAAASLGAYAASLK